MFDHPIQTTVKRSTLRILQELFVKKVWLRTEALGLEIGPRHYTLVSTSSLPCPPDGEPVPLIFVKEDENEISDR